MDAYDVRRLALLSAINVEVEGMKAENKQREVQGESMAYTEHKFVEKAEELKDLAYTHNDQLFGL